MSGKKKRRKEPGLPPAKLAAEMLPGAISRRQDFLLTFETGDEGKRSMHIMTGNLITPCMLGTLSNRCEQPDHENCCHLVLRMD